MRNYVSTEKSLKRWLKMRVKITMATVVGFLIAGTVAMGATAEEYKDKPIVVNSGQNVSITEDFSTNIEFVNAEKPKDNPSNIYGIRVNNGGKFEIDGKNIALNVDSNVDTFIDNQGKEQGVQLAGLMVTANSEGAGTTRLGKEDTEEIKVNINSKKQAIGLAARGNGNDNKGSALLEVNGKNLNVTVKSTDSWSYGIIAQNSSTESAEENRATVIINAENTVVNAEGKDGGGSGLAALSQGILEVNGNLTVTADAAITTRGKSSIIINKNNDKTIKLNGNIDFSYDAETSGTTIESGVILNLSNESSYLNGKITPTGNAPEGKDKVTGMKLGLSNGGTWKVTGDSFVNDLTMNGGILEVTDDVDNINVDRLHGNNGTALFAASVNGEETGDSFVNDLTMNGGILEVTDDVDNINVDRLHGNNGTALFAASVNGEEIEVTDGKLNISEVKDNTNLEVGLSGVNTDDLAENNIKAETALEKLTNKVVGKDGANIENIDQTLFVDGGTLTGKVTAEKLTNKVVGKDGANIENIDQTLFVDGGTLTGKVTADLENGKVTNIQQAKDTPTIAAIRDLTAINYLSWKQEMSSLSQRMGELRDSSAEHGVWARVYGGKVENGSQYNNEYQTYQVGYDKKYTVDNGRVYLGYLVSYTDGETNYSYGTGENYSVGAGIYATWMNNNGHYVDVLYKVSRLNNKFDMNDTEKLKGDYDTYGISLSAEYGKRFDITDKWFAEPSVGMHLGRLGDETYTTDSGIEICQDSIYTAEGRVGAAVGYKFSDKGNVYARTHVVKEFAGEVDTEYEIYATWMNTNGHYVDVLYKVSRLNNKFDMNDTEKLKGDYDTYGISLSAEYGKRFDLGEKWFAEPNVGMHLGQLSSETYTTNTGIEVSQDSIYTAEGRVGVAVGYKFSDKGNVYARTHVVKEFAGDVDTEFERNGVHAKVSEDMEDTGDSTVDTKWQANLGFRYEF